MMENVIVTGGTGFLGRNMIRRLCKEGYRVYAVVRPESRNLSMLPKHENIIPVLCNLSEIRKNKMLVGRPYWAFFHFAWAGVNRDEIDDEAVQQRSMYESMETLKAANELCCRCFIFAGSRSEYGVQNGSFQEDANCTPQVAYGHAKLEFGKYARDFCRGSNMCYIHARIFSVYGPDDHPWSLIYTAVTKMLKNETMNLSPCTHLWNFMDVRDMADLLLTFALKCEQIPQNDSGIFNVATRDVRPLKEFVEEIYSITQSKSNLRFGAFQQSADSTLSVVPDMGKVEKIFGWKQNISFDQGINDMIRQVKINA